MFNITHKFLTPTSKLISVPDEESLRYYLFLGTVQLVNGNDSINIDWDNIPLLDFSYIMFCISEILSNKIEATESFSFTESDDTISFLKKEADLHITTSYSSEKIEGKFDEFAKEAKSFYKKIVTEIEDEYVDIKKSPFFLIYSDKVKW